MELLSEIALGVAGAIVIRNITGQRRPSAAPAPSAACSEELLQLQSAVDDLQARIQKHESVAEKRFAALDKRLSEQEARIAKLPSTGEIIAAMETLLAKAMGPLEERFAEQARSIRGLRSTASQTDELLKRVLDNVKDTLENRPAF